MEMNQNIETIVNEVVDKQVHIAYENYREAWENIKYDLYEKWIDDNKELLESLGFQDCDIDVSFASKDGVIKDEKSGERLPHLMIDIWKEGNNIELIFPNDVKKDDVDYSGLYNAAWDYTKSVNTASVKTKEHETYQALSNPLWKEQVTKNVLEMQEKLLHAITFSDDPAIVEEQRKKVEEILANIITAEFDGATSTITVVTKEGKKIIVSGPGVDPDYGFMYLGLLDACSVKNRSLYEEEVKLDSINVVLKHPIELNPKKQEIKSNGGTPIQTKEEDTKDLNSENVKTKSEITKEVIAEVSGTRKHRIINKNAHKKKKIEESAIDRLENRLKKRKDNVKHWKICDFCYHIFYVKMGGWFNRYKVVKGATLADVTGNKKDKEYQVKLPKKLVEKIDAIYENQNFETEETNVNEETVVNQEEQSQKNNPQPEIKQQEPLLLTDDLIKEPVVEETNEKNSTEKNVENKNDLAEQEKIDVVNKVANVIFQKEADILASITSDNDPKEMEFQRVCSELQSKMANGTAMNEDYQRMAAASNAYENYKQEKLDKEKEIAALHAKEMPDVFTKKWKIQYAKNELLKDMNAENEEQKKMELDHYLEENGITRFEYEAGRGLYSDELEKILKIVEKENTLKKMEEEKVLEMEEEKKNALKQMIEWERLGDPIGARSYMAVRRQELGITDEEINQAYMAYEQENREMEQTGKSK